MKYKRYLLILSLMISTHSTWSKWWTFDQLVDQAFSNSKVQKIIQKNQQADELSLSLALAPFDWQTGVNLLTHNKKWNQIQLNPIHWSSQKIWNTTYFLRRKSQYGLLLQANYTRCALLPTIQSYSPLCTINQPYGHQLSISFEQSIFRNFFGRRDRLQLKSAKHLYKNLLLSRKQELEKLIITIAEKFWNAYSAYTHLNQAKYTTKDYRELVRIVKRKSKLGHTQPGELPQILSRYEFVFQNQKQIQTTLANAILDLQTFLQIKDDDMQFKTHQFLSLKDQPVKKPISSLKSFQMIQNQYLSEKAKLDNQKYFYLPFVQLKANINYSTSDSNQQSAFNTLKDKNYYIGLNLTYPIPSSFSRWRDLKNLKAKQESIQLDYEQKKSELSNQIQSNWNLLKQAYSNMQSTQKISQLQKKALQQIRKSYIQGRIDFHLFIQAQSASTKADLDAIHAKKIYHLSLLKFDSLNDQLLNRYQK